MLTIDTCRGADFEVARFLSADVNTVVCESDYGALKPGIADLPPIPQ